MLSPEQLEHFRQALTAREQEVAEQLEAVERWCAPVEPDRALGRLTRSDAMQDQQMALHQRERLQLQQTRIQTAFQRIQDGTYGLCVLCKKPIDPQRLEMMPESPLCVPCLEKRSAERDPRTGRR